MSSKSRALRAHHPRVSSSTSKDGEDDDKHASQNEIPSKEEGGVSTLPVVEEVVAVGAPESTAPQVEEDNLCAICQESLRKGTVTALVGCWHEFHERCIKKIIALECPLCRAPIEPGDVSKDVYDSIYKNYRQRQDELEDEDMVAAQQIFEQENRRGGAGVGMGVGTGIGLLPPPWMFAGDGENSDEEFGEFIRSYVGSLAGIVSRSDTESRTHVPNAASTSSGRGSFLPRGRGSSSRRGRPAAASPPRQSRGSTRSRGVPRVHSHAHHEHARGCPGVLTTSNQPITARISYSDIMNSARLANLPPDVRHECWMAANLMRSMKPLKRLLHNFVIEIDLAPNSRDPGDVFLEITTTFMASYVDHFTSEYMSNDDYESMFCPSHSYKEPYDIPFDTEDEMSSTDESSDDQRVESQIEPVSDDDDDELIFSDDESDDDEVNVSEDGKTITWRD